MRKPTSKNSKIGILANHGCNAWPDIGFDPNAFQLKLGASCKGLAAWSSFRVSTSFAIAFPKPAPSDFVTFSGVGCAGTFDEGDWLRAVAAALDRRPTVMARKIRMLILFRNHGV